MITLKKVSTEDFEHIYPLLLGFNNPRLSKEDWRQLFVNHWNNQEDYFGFALVDEETTKFVGFMGLIFSTREIDGKSHKFANMTSWIIDNRYRRKGLGRKLLDQVMNLKGYTITDFTAALDTRAMLEHNGFKIMDATVTIIRPALKPSTIGRLFNPNYSIVSNPAKVKDYLNNEELKIFNHHKKFKCFHLIMKEKKSGETCYLLLSRTFRGRYPHARAHYISNLEVFARCLAFINAKICLRFRVLGVIVDKRILAGKTIENAIQRPMPFVSAFKSDTLEEHHFNDTLYTELILLNL
jgi:hypothetical protein